MIEPKLVVGYYNRTSSIRKTASLCGCSEQKVRKILATQGVYCTPLMAKINEYYKKGFSAEMIAEKLKMSKNAVIGYLPYERGQLTRWDDMDAPRSNTAIAVKKCRDKQKNAE